MKNKYNNFYKTSDGEKIFYSTNFNECEKITKPVIVFNYGLVCSNFHWSKQLDYFDSLGYPILIHDYRGHYQSSGIDNLEGITFDRITSDIYELCNYLEISKTIQIGHSMGVNICLEMASKYPSLVYGLILISGTLFRVKDVMFDTNIMEILTPTLEGVLKKYPKAFHMIWKSSGINPLIQKMVHMGGFNINTVSSEFVEIYINKLTKLGPELFFQLFSEMSKTDILSKVDDIECPSLIISGDRDKIIPNHIQHVLKESLNADLYIVRNGSHVPQVDFPSEVNERITYFLEKSIA
jgi:non-heme chloroperoxidase